MKKLLKNKESIVCRQRGQNDKRNRAERNANKGNL